MNVPRPRAHRGALRGSLRTAILLAASGLLSGCGDDGGTSRSDGGDMANDPSGDPALELGTGVNSFEPLPETGDSVELVAGAQGGWHLFGSVRIYGVALDDTILRYDVTDAEDGETLIQPTEVLLTERRVLHAEDHFVRLGDRLVFDISEPSEVIGRRIEISAELDTSDAKLTDRLQATVVDEQ